LAWAKAGEQATGIGVPQRFSSPACLPGGCRGGGDSLPCGVMAGRAPGPRGGEQLAAVSLSAAQTHAAPNRLAAALLLLAALSAKVDLNICH